MLFLLMYYRQKNQRQEEKSTVIDQGLGRTSRSNKEAIMGNEKIFNESNRAWISGIIQEEFEYSHNVLSKRFYQTKVGVMRLSGIEDCVPIVVSEEQLTNIQKGSLKGKYVKVGGKFCSCDKLGEDGRKHLKLFLMVITIDVCESRKEFQEGINKNEIYLEGYLCKPPVFRETPSGKQLTDLMLAVGKDHIPCIAWGLVAQHARELEVGSRINLFGRIQSRQYFKRVSPNSEAGENRTVHEVSIMKILQVEELR